MDKAYGPPCGGQSVQRHLKDTRAVGRIAGHSYDRCSGLRKLGHDRAERLARIDRRSVEQKIRTIRNLTGEGVQHDRQMLLIAGGLGVVKQLPHQIKPRIGPYPADYADSFFLLHDMCPFGGRGRNLPRRMNVREGGIPGRTMDVTVP